jgi:hypothetical protein
MLYPFFALAAQSPSRQRAFRQVTAAHLAALLGAVWLIGRQPPGSPVPLLGHMLLVAGIIEGAMLVGWRLTQLPKSQALEFLLVSPLRPPRLLTAEALVGLTQLALVTLAGLPVLALLAGLGVLDPLDLLPLTLLPFTWGALTGLMLTVWAYEPLGRRRWGELLVMLFILFYLVVGVLAGENLRYWVEYLPETARSLVLEGFARFHSHNPFGALQFWLENRIIVSWERMLWLEVGSLAVLVLLLARAAWRLQGHFHDRHYQPIADVADEKRPQVSEQPLSWWAVKRVSEYSGRINLWLAGGFGLLYAVYTVAGPHWPAWLGRAVFQLCDSAGGIAGLATGLVLLAAVPAAFQYGLWDSNAQDRCRRLELLLLTELQPRDYWNAAAAAAWRRGRGYFAVALLLWLAAALAGQMSFAQVAAALAAGVLLWGLYFALGFRAFARGLQANGLGTLLTIGLPLLAFGLYRLQWAWLGAVLPPGIVYTAGSATGSLLWLLGPLLVAGLTLVIGRHALRSCDGDLRRWYDQHHGSKVMA